MLVLFETASGFALFKLLNEKKLKSIDNLYEEFETPEKAGQILQMQHFQKFADTSEALTAITGVIEGKMSRPLKKLLKKVDVGEQLAITDAKLGAVIRDKTGLQCVTSAAIHELVRCIRQQTDNLLPQLAARDVTAMRLGLAHSLSRYRLKFSPDKVDTMIVQAVSLLDDLDKELNNYVMRCREWYGWHFPELGKLIADNLTYVRVVDKIGVRTNALDTDLSDLLPEDVEGAVKKSAEISMGTEIADEDMLNIRSLCDQIKEISEYRISLHDYLKNRMMAVAPNLSVLVGDIVGARLISHAGSLINLAKHPASTVQILGAEKALFRALKTKHDTPKYGLIYHAQFVSQASQKLKGKASRMLATKASLACRIDALSEAPDAAVNSQTDDKTSSSTSASISCSAELGLEHRSRLEARLRQLEEGVQHRLVSGSRSHQHQHATSAGRGDSYTNVSVVKKYDDAADSIMPSSVKRRFEDGQQGLPKRARTDQQDLQQVQDDVEEKPSQAELDGSYVEPQPQGKKRRSKKHVDETADSHDLDQSLLKTEDQEEEPPAGEDSAKKGKKKKKKDKKEQQQQEETGADVTIGQDQQQDEEEGEEQDEQAGARKKKKKRKHSESAGNVEEAMSSDKKKKDRKSKSEDVEEVGGGGDVADVVAPSSDSKKKKKKSKQDQ